MTSALEADDKPVDPSTMAKVVQRDRGNPDAVGEMHDAIASALVSPEDKKGATFLGENAHFLRTLFLEEDRVEAAMAHALNHLLNLLVDDPTLVPLWEEAMQRAQAFDGTRSGGTESSADEVAMQALRGERPNNLQSWLNSSQRYLRQFLTGSTYAELGSSYNVGRLLAEAKRQNSSGPLLNLARHLRTAIEVKRFQNTAAEILKEREKLLRAKFGLNPHEPILSKHLEQTPYYGYITMEQFEAYSKGDRSPFVFSIEEPEEKTES